MVNIGEIIAKLRKEADLTQEALANMLGVSAQAISKWETGTTMPDIMLLPIIADVFDTDIDTLFCRQKRSNVGKIRRENAYEGIYNSFLETSQELMTRLDNNPANSNPAIIKQKAWEASEFFKNNPKAQFLVLSNMEGNGIFANGDIALTFVKNKDDIFKLFDNDDAWTVIKRFADGETRAVFKHILDNREKSFTSAFIAAKCGIDIKAAERALENLLQMRLIGRHDVLTDEGTIHVYFAYATYKTVLIYSMLTLAATLGQYEEKYRGFYA